MQEVRFKFLGRRRSWDAIGMLLDLTPDELLATTRSVRRRLDLTRPVEREVLEECLGLAQQAPTASYAQNWHFVVVTDPQRRAALGELWRAVAGPYLERRAAAAAADDASPASPGRSVPGRPHPRGAGAGDPVRGGPHRPCSGGGAGLAVGLNHPGGLELHAGRPCSRAGQRLDHLPSVA